MKPELAEVSFPFVQMNEDVINQDMHMHCRLTDGKNTLQEMYERSRELGLDVISFTEHIRRTSDIMEEFLTTAGQIREIGGKPRVFVSAEVKLLDFEGNLDIRDEDVGRFDLIFASVHRFPSDGGKFIPASKYSYEEAVEIEKSLALRALNNPLTDVISHPGGMCIRHFGGFPISVLREILEKGKQLGKVIEFSSSYMPAEYEEWVEAFREINPRVVVSSDAHGVGEVGRCRNFIRRKLLYFKGRL